MQLTVLGTATPYPRPGNACSGYLLQSGTGIADVADPPTADAADSGSAAGSAAGTAPRTSVWVDAGTGTLAELQRHIDPADLDAIWISHRHADHSADLLVAYYALRFAGRRREQPIPLIAPEGMLDRLAAFLGPNAVDELPKVFDFQAMSGWGERTIGALTLEWGPVQHGVPAFGLAVSEDAASIRRFAYSGDSAPCISLEELGEHADLLLVECGYDEEAPADPVHHTPEGAGRSAAAAGAARLVLTHVADTVTDADAVARASAHFGGAVELARPGLVFTV